MSYRQTLEVLVGPLGKERQQYTSARADQGALVINDASVRGAFHGGVASLGDNGLSGNYDRLQHCLVIEALRSDRDVVIDRATSVPKSRIRYIRLARDYAAQIVAVSFPGIPSCHEPRKDEGFDSIVPWFVAKDLTAKGGW